MNSSDFIQIELAREFVALPGIKTRGELVACTSEAASFVDLGFGVVADTEQRAVAFIVML